MSIDQFPYDSQAVKRQLLLSEHLMENCISDFGRKIDFGLDSE